MWNYFIQSIAFDSSVKVEFIDDALLIEFVDLCIVISQVFQDIAVIHTEQRSASPDFGRISLELVDQSKACDMSHHRVIPLRNLSLIHIFVQEQGYWLNDYALFMACKERNEGRSWLEWDEQYRTPTEDRKEQLRSRLSQAIGFYQFTQFLFFDEWMRLKEYANQKDIRIIGDIPIFVSMDSADVWASQHLFQLDSDGYPLKVAGVPPDYFSATGQLWGNRCV